MSYRFAIIRTGHITGRLAEDVVKHVALTDIAGIIAENASPLVAKYSATPYFSTMNLKFQQKVGPCRYIKKNYQLTLLV